MSGAGGHPAGPGGGPGAGSGGAPGAGGSSAPRILVAGAGAVGSWLGAAAILGGAEAVLVARGAHGREMAALGLTVHAEDGAKLAHLHPCVRPSLAAAAEDGPFDLVVIAVKGYATAGLAGELAVLDPLPPILSVQNGVGNEAVLAAALPGAAVIPAALTTAVVLTEPGVVVAGRKGGLAIATLPGTGALLARLAVCLEAGGLATRLQAEDPSRGAALKWSKLLLNLLGGASAAILGWPPERVFADRRLFGLERRAWLEALAVMDALGMAPIDLPGYPVSLYARLLRRVPEGLLFPLLRGRLSRGRRGRLPGIAADLAAGRRESEVELLNGAVARFGAERGLPTPVNATLTAIVMGLARGELDLTAYRGRPEALLAAVEAARASGERSSARTDAPSRPGT